MLLSFRCLFFFYNSVAQQLTWRKAEQSAYSLFTKTSNAHLPAKFILCKTDLVQLKTLLQSAPIGRSDGRFASGILISLLLPDETVFTAGALESPICEEQYARQFSQLKTYILTDSVTKSIKDRLTLTAEGVSGMLFSAKGDVYINPVNLEDPGTHLVYFICYWQRCRWRYTGLYLGANGCRFSHSQATSSYQYSRP